MVRKLFFLLLLLAVGCTKAVPQFDTLDSSRIPQPLYAGKTEHTIQVPDTTSSIAVTGTCDAKVEEMSFRIAGYKEWTTAADISNGSGATVDCQGSGAFAFSLPSLSTMQPFTGWNLSQTVRFKLEAKAHTSSGDSSVSKLTVEYVLAIPVKPGTFHITSAGGVKTSTNLSAAASVRAIDGGPRSSASLQVKHQRQ